MNIRNFALGLLTAYALLGSANAATLKVVFDNSSAATAPVVTLDDQILTVAPASFVEDLRGFAETLTNGKPYTLDSVFDNEISQQVGFKRLTVTLDSADVFSSYFDGVLDFTESGNIGYRFAPGSPTSQFFEELADQGLTRKNGTVTYLTLYDRALTAGEVANLGAVPEPEALSLVLAGVAIVTGVAVRRRRTA